MQKDKFNLEKTIIKDREALLQAGVLASMEILKDHFGFTQEQLNKFAELYVPTLQSNLKGNKK